MRLSIIEAIKAIRSAHDASLERYRQTIRAKGRARIERRIAEHEERLRGESALVLLGIDDPAERAAEATIRDDRINDFVRRAKETLANMYT